MPYRGLEAIKRCKRVFLEAYTSILLVGTAELETLYGKKVETADREMVESQADVILEDATDDDVAFCVVGDPFGATTHSDLVLRAHKQGIKVSIIHNASIMNAIAACGLQLYRFGQVCSLLAVPTVHKYCSLIRTSSAPLKHTVDSCLLFLHLSPHSTCFAARDLPPISAHISAIRQASQGEELVHTLRSLCVSIMPPADCIADCPSSSQFHMIVPKMVKAGTLYAAPNQHTATPV